MSIRGKTKSILKRVATVLSVTTLLFTNGVALGVTAEEAKTTEQDSKTLSRSMIEYFRTANALDENCITNDEMRVFGAFISNFYRPYTTNLLDIATDTAEGSVYDKVLNTFFGGDTNQEQMLKTVLDKVQSGVTANSEFVYANGDVTKGVTLHTLLNYAHPDNKIKTLQRENGAVVFDLDNTYCRELFDLTFICDVAGTQNFIQNFGSKAKAEKIKITPFGDIITESGLVVVPACLNPYTFYKTSNINTEDKVRFPVNNAFIMGNLLSGEDMVQVTYDKSDSETLHGELFGIPGNDSGGVVGVNEWINDQWGDDIPFQSATVKDNNFVVIGYSSIKTLNDSALEYNEPTVLVKSRKYKNYFDTGVGWWSDAVSELWFKTTTQDSIDEMCTVAKVPATDVIDCVGSFTDTSWGSEDTSINVYGLYADGAEVISGWEKAYNDSADFRKPYVALTKGGTVGYNANLSGNPIVGKFMAKDENDVEYEEHYHFPYTQSMNNYIGVYTRTDTCCSTNGTKYLALHSTTELPESYFAGVMSTGAARLVSPSEEFVKALSRHTTQWSDKSINIADKVNLWGGIYWGYLYEILGIETDDDGMMTSGAYDGSNLPNLDIGLRYGAFNLADMLSGVDPVESEANELEKMQEDITRKVYNLLSTSHNDYRESWIKGIINETVLSIHNAVIGSDFTGSIMKIGTGNSTSTYTGVMGYVTTPKLAELPFTSWIISNYDTIYLVIMIIMLVVLLFMFISKQKKLPELIALFILLAFVMVLPKTLVDGMIGITNTYSESLYNDRFLFWALSQHQQADDELAGAGEDGDAQFALMSDLQDVENMVSDTGIRLKWMSPKKTSKLNQLLGNKMSNELTANTTIFRWLFSGIMQQETYVTDPLATYVYRPYNDLNTLAQDLSTDLDAVDVANFSDITQTINNYYSMNKGETDEATERVSLTEGGTFLRALYSDPAYKYKPDKALVDLADSVRGKSVSYSYITELFGSEAVNDAMFESVLEEDETSPVGLDIDKLSGDELTKANTFILYSESPYYYFYNVFKQAKAQVQTGEDEYTEITVDGTGGTTDVNDFAHILISKDFFKVTNDTNKNKSDYNQYAGEIRDFLNMEGLFTYVIPYLNYGNEYVQLWTQEFGADISDIDYTKALYSAAVAESEMVKRDKIHNDCLGRVWNMYTPWVDTLYDTGVYNFEINTALYSEMIYDTVNPASYMEAGRRMCFSPADMEVKNLKESELTDIEYKIIKTLEDTYEDIMYLNNYQGFDDEVLISAAAMLATFNFNENFSNDGILEESYTLYPQSFEMKNMNYDAFLRMIIMNNTGEALSSTDGSVYVRMLNKSSLFTSLFLLVNDCLSVYVIPAAKIILLFALMVLSLIMLVYAVIAPREEIKKVLAKTLLLPIALFGLLLMGMSTVISLFVGEGLTSIVGQRGISVVTNDPAVTLLLLMLVNIVFIILMWQIFKKIWKAIKEFAPNLAVVAGGAIAAGAVAGFNAARSGVSGVARGVSSGFGELGSQTVGRKGRARRDRKATKRDRETALDLQRDANTIAMGQVATQAEANEIARGQSDMMFEANKQSIIRDNKDSTESIKQKAEAERKALYDIDAKASQGHSKKAKSNRRQAEQNVALRNQKLAEIDAREKADLEHANKVFETRMTSTHKAHDRTVVKKPTKDSSADKGKKN